MLPLGRNNSRADRTACSLKRISALGFGKGWAFKRSTSGMFSMDPRTMSAHPNIHLLGLARHLLSTSMLLTSTFCRDSPRLSPPYWSRRHPARTSGPDWFVLCCLVAGPPARCRPAMGHVNLRATSAQPRPRQRGNPKKAARIMQLRRRQPREVLQKVGAPV